MKHIRFFMAGIGTIILSTVSAGAQVTDSVVMGQGYSNDVYYSLSSGTVKTEPNSNWHIAFSTAVFSSSILLNDGADLTLYTYPYGDYMAWDTLSTDSIANWDPLYNSPLDWMTGAFDRNATGHPDYGWGIYNSSTHDVVGDSLFVIQFGSDSTKKLWIEKKISVQNTYIIHYANPDGSVSVSDTLDINPYTAKNFVYYSMETGELVDREPEEPWDLVFTRYYDERIPYRVTGVLSNTGVEAARLEQADTAMSCYGHVDFWDSRSAIGHDWKTFNMSAFRYEITDSLVFVVLDTTKTIYNLYFTGFTGQGSGVAEFVLQQATCGLGIDQASINDELHVFPNPAGDELFIARGLRTSGPFQVQLFDAAGRLVSVQIIRADENGLIRLRTASFEPGIYVLRLGQNGNGPTARIIIK